MFTLRIFVLRTFMLRMIGVGALVAWSSTAASIIPGDARRGEQLFETEQCIQCQHRAIGALREERLSVGVQRHDGGAEAEAQRSSGHQQHDKCDIRHADQQCA